MPSNMLENAVVNVPLRRETALKIYGLTLQTGRAVVHKGGNETHTP